MLALCGENNRLPLFFELAKKYNCQSPGLFVDVGANIGSSSIEACNHEVVSKCIAFEPSTENFTLLRTNIAVNSLENRIEAHKLAIGDDTDSVGLHLIISDFCSGDNRVRKKTQQNLIREAGSHFTNLNSEVCATVTLDSFFKNNLEQVRFLWVDVQGYEYHVLHGCEGLLELGSVSVQIEYWPSGLIETGTLKMLNALLIKHFKYYVDMSEYNGKDPRLHDINEINDLSSRLLSINLNAHTDLFLLR